MAEFFSGPPPQREQVFKEDVNYLSRLFEPWRLKVLRWQKMLKPEVPADLMGSSISSTLTSKVEATIAGQTTYHPHYRTNFVPTGCTSLINRMNRSPVIIEVNIQAQDQAEMEKADIFEDFNTGLLNVLNEEYARSGEGTSFLRKVYESIVFPGKAVSYVQMRRGAQKQAVPQVESYDPYGCFHTFRGPVRRFGRQVVRSAEEVERLVEEAMRVYGARMPLSLATLADARKNKQGIIVTEYWLQEQVKVPSAPSSGWKDSVWNGLLIDGEVSYLRKTSFKKMPVIITSTNTVNRNFQQVGLVGDKSIYASEMIENHAEPWFAPGENTIGQWDTLLSLQLAAIHLATFPPIEIKRDDGSVGYQFGGLLHTPGAIVWSTPQEAIRVLELVRSTAAEARQLADFLRLDLEYLLPSAVRGEIPAPGSSGYLFDRLTDTQKNSFVDIFAGASVHIKSILQELDQQFYDDGALNINLKSRQLTDGPTQGKYYVRNFTKADFPTNWDFDVVLDPQVPENDAAKVEIFRSVTDPAVGGMSKLRARGEILKLRHPLQEQQRIDAERAESSVVFDLIRLKNRLREEIITLNQRVARARADGREDDADSMELDALSLAAELERLESSGSSQKLPASGRANGFSPEVLPPAATTRSPQIAASARGEPSTGTGGQGGKGGEK